MTLYHFCAEKYVGQIIRQGLTIGMVTEPTPTGYRMHNGYIWLTTDPDPTQQSWATRIKVKYSRTAYRLTVEIPDEECVRVHDRAQLRKIFPSCDVLFKHWPRSENWRVFRGMIPKEWIVKVEKMEGNA